MAQVQNATGTAGSGGAQKGSAVYKYGAGQGAGVDPGDKGQLTETHVDYHNNDAGFTTHTHKQAG